VRHLRSPRDTLVGGGALVATVGFLLLTAAAALRLIDGIQSGFVPPWYSIGRGLEVVSRFTLAAAFTLTALAFLGVSKARQRRLAAGAAVATGGFTGALAAEGVYATVYGTRGFPGAFVASYATGASEFAVLAIAAAMVATRFRLGGSPRVSSRAPRDQLLAWSGIALTLGFALAAASAILYLESVADRTGLEIAAAGLALAAAAGVPGARAFFDPQRRKGQSVGRDGLLAIALAMLALGFLLQGIGEAIHVENSPVAHFDRIEAMAECLDASAALTTSLGAAFAAGGFCYSRRLAVA
jgi:hypothetical protein